MTPGEWEQDRARKIEAQARRATRARTAVKNARAPRRHRGADLTDREFGRLIVHCKAPRHLWRDHQTCWLCICTCGRLATIRQKTLLNGDSRSCGCESRRANWRHGRERTPEHNAWCRMRRLFHRGAAMFEPWSDFLRFLADVGPRPADHVLLLLDRSRGIMPGNLAWRHKSVIAEIGLAALRRKWSKAA